MAKIKSLRTAIMSTVSSIKAELAVLELEVGEGGSALGLIPTLTRCQDELQKLKTRSFENFAQTELSDSPGKASRSKALKQMVEAFRVLN